MPKHPYHQTVHLENFTAFRDSEFQFSPGVNAIIGENGSGKTHLLKAIYAYQRPPSREAPNISDVLGQLFQTESAADLVRTQTRRSIVMQVSGLYGDKAWAYGSQSTREAGNGDGTGSGMGSGSGAGNEDGSGDGYGRTLAATVVRSSDVKMSQPIFIPAIDMMGHTKGFREAYSSVFLDFDLTCFDILNLFNLKSRAAANDSGPSPSNAILKKMLGGDIVADETSGRFFLTTVTGRTEMPMVAEGLRKIASLVRLQDNNWLAPGATLYWDEPEANINPILMDELVSSILSMARQGIQVFLTTHSYVILKELDLQATEEDKVRFFSLEGNKSGTKVTTADELTGLAPNSILEQYGSLYNRDIRRATGRKPVR